MVPAVRQYLNTFTPPLKKKNSWTAGDLIFNDERENELKKTTEVDVFNLKVIFHSVIATPVHACISDPLNRPWL